MDRRILLMAIIIVLLVINLNVKYFEQKLYNTYTNPDYIVNNDTKSQYKEEYKLEYEGIKFLRRFLADWENNLTLEYLDIITYQLYSAEKRQSLVDYLKKFEVVDKENNEAVIVKNGISKDSFTGREYLNLTYYVTEKINDYSINYAEEITNNSPDANKKFTVIVYSDTPNNFKVKFTVNDRDIIGDGREL